MATIISLKRRMNAAQNVSKTTKAMQMISASKLKKAQEATLSARPYAERLADLTENISQRADKKRFTHPYIEHGTATGKTLLLVLAPDKGLCGALISNILKEFFQYQKSADANTYYITAGKKVENYVSRLSEQIVASFPFGTVTPSFDMIYPLLRIIDDYYLGKKVDAVKILYTDFTSVFSQSPVFVDLLPIALPKTGDKHASTYYHFDQDAKELLPAILRHHVEMSLFHYLLESFASEQASRMISMQNATSNANDIIEDLRLEYNKTRQAKITNELLDIVGSGVSLSQ